MTVYVPLVAMGASGGAIGVDGRGAGAGTDGVGIVGTVTPAMRRRPSAFAFRRPDAIGYCAWIADAKPSSFAGSLSVVSAPATAFCISGGMLGSSPERIGVAAGAGVGVDGATGVGAAGETAAGGTMLGTGMSGSDGRLGSDGNTAVGVDGC